MTSLTVSTENNAQRRLSPLLPLWNGGVDVRSYGRVEVADTHTCAVLAASDLSAYYGLRT